MKNHLNIIYIYWGYLLFALIGGKRAIIIYIPILIFTILFFYYKLNNKNIFADLNFYKTIIAITPAFLLIFYLTVVLIPDHNKEHKVGGSFDIKFVSEYAFGYVTNDAEGQYSLGRAVAPFIAYNTLSNRGYDKILFGLGPGHLIKSSLNKESNSEGEGNTLMFKLYGLGYGARIGMIWMGLQVGILGVFALFLFHLHLLKKTLQLSKISENINYKIIALGQIGCGLVFFIDFFTYSQTTLYIGSMQFIYFFTMGYLHNNNRFETELSLDNEK